MQRSGAKCFEHVSSTNAELTPKQQRVLALVRQERTAGEVKIVTITDGAWLGDSVRFNFNDNAPLAYTKMARVMRGDSVVKWNGLLQGLPENAAPARAEIFARGKNTFGTFHTADGVFSITPLGGGVHAVIKRNLTKLPADHPPKFKEVEQKKRKKPEVSPPLADTPPIVHEVRVLVVYTPNVVEKRAPTDDLAEQQAMLAAFIGGLINDTNLAYQRSGINIRLMLAHAALVNYADSGKLETDLERLQKNGDGHLDNVHTLRNSHAADIVVMLVREADYAGFAADILAKPATAFAVLDEEYNWYYTFAHEIGHLMGARHDLTADPNITPFQHGHGFQHLVTNGWRTIMAYDGTCTCVRRPIWSNPGKKIQGIATGTVDYNDNARVLRHTAPQVSAFRP